MNDPVFHEGIAIRMAYTDLVHHVCVPGTDPDEVALPVVAAGLDDFGVHRFGGLLFAFKQADSIEDAIALAQEVERWVRSGRRPRSLPALLSPEERQAVEETFERRCSAPSSWWKRLGKRVERALIADDETSAWMDRADRETRMREGKQP